MHAMRTFGEASVRAAVINAGSTIGFETLSTPLRQSAAHSRVAGVGESLSTPSNFGILSQSASEAVVRIETGCFGSFTATGVTALVGATCPAGAELSTVTVPDR